MCNRIDTGDDNPLGATGIIQQVVTGIRPSDTLTITAAPENTIYVEVLVREMNENHRKDEKIKQLEQENSELRSLLRELMPDYMGQMPIQSNFDIVCREMGEYLSTAPADRKRMCEHVGQMMRDKLLYIRDETMIVIKNNHLRDFILILLDCMDGNRRRSLMQKENSAARGSFSKFLHKHLLVDRDGKVDARNRQNLSSTVCQAINKYRNSLQS